MYSLAGNEGLRQIFFLVSEENRTHLQTLRLEVIYSCQIQSYGQKSKVQFVLYSTFHPRTGHEDPEG